MNLDKLNEQMISRIIENEFYTNDLKKPFSSLYYLVTRDIADNSSIIGVSLYGSFEKISNRLSNKDELLNKGLFDLQNYVKYIEWNIRFIDLSKFDEPFTFKYSKKSKYSNLICIICGLFLYSITSNNQKLQKTSIYLLKTIVDQTFNCTFSEGFNTNALLIEIFNNLDLMFNFKNEMSLKLDYELCEQLVFTLLENIFKELDNNKVKVVKSRLSKYIKHKLEDIIECSIEQCLNDEEKFKKIINLIRNEERYFISSALANFRELINGC